MRANNSITIAAAAMLIAMMAVSAPAGDWPNYRGPQHNGISDETDWGGDWANCTVNKLWQKEVGIGFSSIVAVDGRIYTMGNSNIETVEHDIVYCLDADTGDTVWTHPYPSDLAPNSYVGGPSATPTVADGNVYTLSKHGMAYCLNADDGDVVWENDLSANYGVTAPVWGFAGSPYIDGDLVIYNVGIHGMALYTANGTLAWLTGTSRPGYSTPAPFDFNGQHYVITMGMATFAAVHVQTGDVLWEQDWEPPQSSKVNAADAVVDGNLVFVSSSYGKGSALFDVSTRPITQIWFEGNVRTKMNGCVLWQGHLYGPDDVGDGLTCMEQSTGDTIWAWDQADNGDFNSGSVTLADGKLIALSDKGDLCIAEASPAGYQQIVRDRILTGDCWTVPVLANGKIYARNSAGNLVCVQLETTGPKVDAGSSVITWLKPGPTTVDLTGTVDDDTGDVTAILWSSISAPRGATVDIADDSAPVTTAAFGQTGVYVFELHAIDATAQEGADRMEVRVYADSCEAATTNPISPHAALYDSDNDCIPTFKDFAAFATDGWETGIFHDFALFATVWLEDESLTTDLRYDAGRITLPGE